MNRDVMTDSVAALGLMTGTVLLADDAGTAVALAGTCRVPLEGGMPGNFYAARDRLSEALSRLWLSDPDAYGAIVSEVGTAGSTGWVACRPRNGIWPDAMLPYRPEACIQSPAGRCYPAAHAALALLSGDDVPDDELEGWCAQNPGALAGHAFSGAMRATGWSSEAGRPVSFLLMQWDFTKPWRILENPDGSDEIRAAETLVCTDLLLNAWAPGMPEGPRQKQTGGEA